MRLRSMGLSPAELPVSMVPPASSHDAAAPSVKAPPTLDTLPLHVLQDIAERTNERTIWSLMASNRALRAASESALKPYLKEAKVIGKPVWMVNIFKPIDRKFAARDNARGLAFRKISDRFTAHLAAYPPAAEHLRHLTVELEDWKEAPGWKHLKRFAPDLVSLEIHMKDCHWQLSIENEVYGDDGRSNIIETSMGTAEVWDTVFVNPETTAFPNLTHLVLACQSRGAEHFARFARYCRSLTHVHISCHFKGEYDMDQPDLIAEAGPFKIQTLTLSGHSLLVFNFLTELLPLAPELDYLTVHISEPLDVSIYSEFPTTLPMVESIAGHKRLKGLAVYGCAAFEFPVWLRVLQDEGKDQGGCQEIKTLVLEQEKAGKDGRPIYPILPPAAQNRPNLNPERTVYVDKRWKKRTGPDSTGFYDHADLVGLFVHYDTLQQVQWVSRYPADPFSNPLPEDIVKCSVNRGDIDALSA